MEPVIVDRVLRMIFHSYFVLCILSVLSAADECVKVDTCTCKTSTRTINLHPLSANTGPRFTIPGAGSDKYFYNPCKDFTEGGVTGVVIQQQGGVYYVTADDNTATFSGDPDLGTLTLSYQHAEGGIIRISKVKLVCMEGTNQLIFNGEDPKLNYKFTLNTESVCIPGSQSGLSTGSILVILFFVLLVAYLIAGILFLRFIRKAEGLELVPNYDFWTAIPSLIRDGIYFTLRGFKTESTYEKI
ncbi:cation-dependent mannose-6-phosphate receptor-like [Haliotis cracherodii]|uniref:cation-dependent mannose-6-phosphate receptor-like n=1 Tax=Haliotis cracherodii TaxID=6455 RepID=UPI0039E8CD73